MYDEYKEAMNVAESYYEREGGYEEFKEKYPNFYYPEEGKDFSAYLPVSNVNLAKFITPEGNVMIGNKVYNMCDINSYSQLDSLGLTLQLDDTPFYLATRATKTFTNYIPMQYNTNKNRRMEVNFNRYFSDGASGIFEVRISFRLKNFLGIWYNASGTTNCKVIYEQPGVGSYIINKLGETGFSPHVYAGRRHINPSIPLFGTAELNYESIPENDYLMYLNDSGE
ncbi:MAG: DUF4848 domain-containing protein [Dysgonamonadaceae bacterium]|jgi:hypothetical protein|nr:DUF4848 domain-containing protein [Dysgonamonadaceae bacterium]MDD3309279.1 DUF4848 domain-containing protein [Dysgonamonadaceae bacterium]MDD3901209.1 DUF4848 domain-containing protein [Dysgonamonadaceae bacterium]MDD4399315.1 DUF4848 domain-containing protein [Dysgonamonadaceae bacterium]MEA5080521.1 DUF4848 domain-containing protein [Dysgonamonadaceae bacterium]